MKIARIPMLLVIIILAVQIAAALDESELQAHAQLIKNTRYCDPLPSGKYHCEAVFTINASAQDKQLYKNVNVFITFEDQAKRNKTVHFNTDFDVGVMQVSSSTVEEQVWIRDDILPNGTALPVYELQNVTVHSEEIIYGGKRLVPGVNYVRIYTDDFDEQWVDWQVLIKGIPVKVDGVDAAVDFDTHSKGWAVWSISTAVAGVNLTSGLIGHYGLDNSTYLDDAGILGNLAATGSITFSAITMRALLA